MRREHAKPARAARKGTFADRPRAHGRARARSPRSGEQDWGLTPKGQTPQDLAEDRDVERVVRRNSPVVPCLDPGVARRVETRRAGATLASAAAGAGRGLATLISGVSRVAARREDQVARHGAAEVEQIVARRRVRGERDPTGLRSDSAVRTDERPADRRTASRRTCWSRGPCRAGRARRPGRAARNLSRPEVTREQTVIPHLHARNAVARQRLHCRITSAAEDNQQREARHHHRRRRTQPSQQLHPLTSLGRLQPYRGGTLGGNPLEPCKDRKQRCGIELPATFCRLARW